MMHRITKKEVTITTLQSFNLVHASYGVVIHGLNGKFYNACSPDVVHFYTTKNSIYIKHQAMYCRIIFRTLTPVVPIGLLQCWKSKLLSPAGP